MPLSSIDADRLIASLYRQAPDRLLLAVRDIGRRPPRCFLASPRRIYRHAICRGLRYDGEVLLRADDEGSRYVDKSYHSRDGADAFSI